MVELEQELEVMEGELSAAQQAAKQAPSRTMKALVERLRNQLAMKEKQQRVSCVLKATYKSNNTQLVKVANKSSRSW